MSPLVAAGLEEIRKAAIKKAVDKLMQKIILSAGFFTYPIINKLTFMAVEWIVKKIYDEGEDLAYYGYVIYSVNKQEDEVASAIQTNKVDQTAASKLALIDKFRKFAKLRS